MCENHHHVRKILNPYTTLEGYNCFGCSPNNSFGLKLNFVEDGEFIVAEWIPNANFSGYKNILHGGIQATLLDEIASWVVQIKLKTSGFTGNLNIRYRKPVYVDEGAITIKAKLEKNVRNLAYIHAWLYNSKGEIGSEADLTYFVYPEDVARKKLYLPNYEDYFEKD